jgi:hypothetical protein
MLPSVRRAALFSFALWMIASTAGAQPASEPRSETPSEHAPSDPTLTTGRGFSWGGSIVVPMLLGDVRYAGSDERVPFYSPGGGVLGRIGWELPYGLAIYGIFSLQAFAVEAQQALLLYRGSLEVRWTIDTGTPVLPFVTAGGSALFYIRDGVMAPTGGVHASAGIAYALAWWAQLEANVELDVAFPGEAFADTVMALVPSVGGTFFF